MTQYIKNINAEYTYSYIIFYDIYYNMILLLTHFDPHSLPGTVQKMQKKCQGMTY